MQEEECVRRRGWLDRQRFLDLVAATNLIPGPNSTEMAIHLGRLRAGWPGLVVGGIAFILPSAVLVTALAWAYIRWGAVPAATAILATLRPAVLVVIVDALWGFARTAIRSPLAALVAALAAAGSRSAACRTSSSSRRRLAIGLALARLAPGRLRAVPLGQLLLVCTKIGATLFGSGYVLIAYLRAEIVGRGWLDDARLLDAVAIGQLTPGPVSTAATFVGYLVAGWPGAVVATTGMFLPSFAFVAATGTLVERWRTRPVLRARARSRERRRRGAHRRGRRPPRARGAGDAFALVVAATAGVALWVFGFSTHRDGLGAAALAGLARGWLPGAVTRRLVPGARPAAQPEQGQRPARQLAPRGRVGVAPGMGGVHHLLPRAEPRQREGAVRRRSRSAGAAGSHPRRDARGRRSRRSPRRVSACRGRARRAGSSPRPSSRRRRAAAR